MNRLFISPDERRLRAGWRLLAQLSLFGIFAVASVLIVFPLLNDGAAAALGRETVQLLAIAIPVYLARRFIDRRSFISLGLVWDAQARRDLLAGLGIAGATVSLLFLSYWALGWSRLEGFAWQTQRLPAFFGSLLVALVLLLMSGWGEELMARGYWLQNLEEGLTSVWAVLISSALFSLSHFRNPGFGWIPFLGLFVGGFDLAYGYLRTRRLWLPVGLHVGWNFFEGVVYGFPLSGLSDAPQLIIQSVQGPAIWTGGSFGPEAGLLMLPAVGLNIGLIYLYARGFQTKESTRDMVSNGP